MTEVAIRMFHITDAVIHETDENGRPACRMGDRDIKFRTFERSDLPDDMRDCSYCSGEVPNEGAGNCEHYQALVDASPDEVMG